MATTATNVSVDKTDDKSFTDMITLLNAVVTDDNKETIREFLELMKKCNPVVKVEDKRLYPHIKFQGNKVNLEVLTEFSKNPIINNILENFIPSENCEYEIYKHYNKIQIYEFDHSSRYYFFDVVTGMLVNESAEEWFFSRFANNQGYNVNNGRDFYNYNLSNKLESIEFVIKDNLLWKASINEEDVVTIIVYDKEIIGEYPKKIQEYIDDLKANKQLSDKFRLAPKYLKKE